MPSLLNQVGPSSSRSMDSSISKNDDSRSRDIRTVIEEREKLVEIAERLVPLLDNESNRLEVQKGVLELSGHLANIGGFCDQAMKEWINYVQRVLATMSGSPPMTSALLKLALPLIVGVQVDFNKRPFKAIGIDIEALKSRFKAYVQR